MKNITIILALAVAFLSSCEKEIPPVTTNTNSTTTPAIKDITVEYSIYAASGNFDLVYVTMVDGVLKEQSERLTKMNHSITFTTKSQQLISVKARNTSPSHDEVTVSIYVDGNLFKSNSTTTINAWAVASGKPF
jgi:hypothetical protein